MNNRQNNDRQTWYRGSYGTTQLLCKDDIMYVLNGWNGEFYTECYKSDLCGVPLEPKEMFIIKPIKKLVNRKFELYEWDGYEILTKQ